MDVRDLGRVEVAELGLVRGERVRFQVDCDRNLTSLLELACSAW